MKKNIRFSNKNIYYLFNKVDKKYNVELTYSFVNEYQLLNTSINIYTDSNIEISSIDIRKLNIYSLNKKALKQISNYSDIDPKNFIKKRRKIGLNITLFKKLRTQQCSSNSLVSR